jgi:hypothetical protein
MATRYSRYREPPVALAADARGRTPATTPFRALPEVAGTFRHVVAEGERLDQIAFRYYEEPTVWWRICDANPQFVSPLALLGQDSVGAARFRLRGKATEPPPDWAMVKRALTGIVGVEYVAVDEDMEYVTVKRTVNVPPLGPRTVPVVEEHFRRSLVVRFNRTATSAHDLYTAITAAGVNVDSPADTGQLGRQIVIPPPGTV